MKKTICILIALVSLQISLAFAQTTVAVFNFSSEEAKTPEEAKIIKDILAPLEKATEPSGGITLGIKTAEVIRTELSKVPHLQLVEREKLEDILSEMGLSKTGIVDETTAIKAGNLLGAKILVLGNCFVLEDNLFLNARVIGTETSALFAETVKGPLKKEIEPLAKELAGNISKVISEKRDSLLAKEIREPSIEEKIAQIRSQIEGKLPKIKVSVKEERIGGVKIDSVVETEIIYFLQKCGFEITEEKARADIEIQGVSFSEFATRRGDLISCKARIELKAVDLIKSRVLTADREYATEVDIAEETAASKALQKASQKLLLRFIPEFIKQWKT